VLYRLLCEERLDAAYSWLCHRRRGYPAHADIWWLRERWQSEKQTLVRELATGRLRFEPLRQVTLKTGESIELWSARDALILKLLAWTLEDLLPSSRRCTHLKNNGGAKYALREVIKHLPRHQFVMRTDVKSYYASIDHHRLLEMLAKYVKDRFVLNLLGQYLQRCVEHGGLYREIKKGISRGCPLSPIIAAFFLYSLDTRMERSSVFYVRFMDDILVLATTRWKLRHAVRQVNQAFSELGLNKHPDKTFIGRIEKGFDFLGYHFSPAGLTVAKATIQKFVERAYRLYEQDLEEPRGLSALVLYVRRWVKWVESGLVTKEEPRRSGGSPLLRALWS